MIKRFLVSLIHLYQKTVSPLLGSCCRFYPSCSEYAKESLVKHGVCKGLLLTLRRLLKCQPWHSGGYDPVPKRWRKKGTLR